MPKHGAGHQNTRYYHQRKGLPASLSSLCARSQELKNFFAEYLEKEIRPGARAKRMDELMKLHRDLANHLESIRLMFRAWPGPQRWDFHGSRYVPLTAAYRKKQEKRAEKARQTRRRFEGLLETLPPLGAVEEDDYN